MRLGGDVIICVSFSFCNARYVVYNMIYKCGMPIFSFLYIPTLGTNIQTNKITEIPKKQKLMVSSFGFLFLPLILPMKRKKKDY